MTPEMRALLTDLRDVLKKHRGWIDIEGDDWSSVCLRGEMKWIGEEAVISCRSFENLLENPNA